MNFRLLLTSLIESHGFEHFNPETANHDTEGLTYDLEDRHHELNMSERARGHLARYTDGGSDAINKKLASGDNSSHSFSADRLSHAAVVEHSRPVGMSFHTFSGIGHDRSAMFSRANPGDTFHSPAHISTSHDWSVAKEFGHRKAKTFGAGMHAIHIHVKPEDKALYVAPISHYPEERETIIPAGTTLKYHGTTTHPDEGRGDTTIHHFTIHSQDDVKIDKGPGGVSRVSHELDTNANHNGSGMSMSDHGDGMAKGFTYHIYGDPIHNHGRQGSVETEEDHHGSVREEDMAHRELSSIKISPKHALKMEDGQVKVPKGSLLRFEGESEHQHRYGVAKVKHYSLV